ncbi:ALF repeat-containing protein [Streptomyces sp. NPDC059411]|uniref:ALF repeat-containing protein n=1 Tax=Streptomyces sp. NPDC059411 TaxID=3346825 RepID=UPI00367F771E
MLLVKLSRIAASVVTAAIAPAVLFASPAFAADSATPAPASAPDEAPAGVAKGGEQAGKKADGDGKRAEDDREAILRLMAATPVGSSMRLQGSKAIDGGPAAMRAFLETGQYVARDQDNRVMIVRIMDQAQMDSEVSAGVVEAGQAALKGTPADRVAFLEKSQYEARDDDNRVWISRIIGKAQAGTGVNRGVIEAGKAALKGSAADREAFLKTGRFKARADDIRVELARMEGAAGPILAKGIDKMFSTSPTLAELEHFLAVTQFELRDEDNRLAISKIINAGGPEVQKAGKAALQGTPADRETFLKTGQAEARAKDEKAAETKPGTGTGTGTGTSGVVTAGAKSVTGSGTGNVNASPAGSTGTSVLASTGTDPLWVSTGAGAALVAGAGFVFAARTRRQGPKA